MGKKRSLTLVLIVIIDLYNLTGKKENGGVDENRKNPIIGEH